MTQDIVTNLVEQNVPFLGTNYNQAHVVTNWYSLSGYRPNDWIWVELSLVAEVECVFVWLEEDMYRVVTIVNDNDEGLRDRIYERELALIEALPMYRFDFYVLPRMGNQLSALVDYAEKPAYRRR
jgi:hypothetical protein